MDKTKMASTTFTSSLAVWRRSICRRNYLIVLMMMSLFASSSVRLTAEANRTDVCVEDFEVNNWAMRFGFHVHEIAKHVTFLDDMIKDYTLAKAEVETKNGFQMVAEMSNDIYKMMTWKIQAVQRITDTAEEAMLGHTYNASIDCLYNNAKTLNEDGGFPVPLTKDKHFYNIPVNIRNSTIHVPTNVYNRAAKVLNAIDWSEQLNLIFVSNYYLDPSLSWQYFGSSTGFLRQFPAMKWTVLDDKINHLTQHWTSETVDTYDCRMRPWYIEAAASPKDMIILMDGSGSMTGLKKEIAKHVALNILDTLNDDDYFNIFRYSDDIYDFVPCFNGSLVPANMENIREYKKTLQNITTSLVANLSLALHRAFALLHEYNQTAKGSNCNQAIMLITDGAPHAYEEIFNSYNEPDRHVRVFTYLIGQEMTEERNVKLMACMNRGFYSHVSTLAEARDQVQQYVHVMARPLVLNQKHSVIWTSVYADIADPKLSDWLWEKREKARNAELGRSKKYRAINVTHSMYEMTDEYLNEDTYADEDYITDHSSRSARVAQETPADDLEEMMENETPFYRLMTTVAYPVFDRRNYSDEVRDLLGVVGTDVPIEEITKLAPAYKLGVNGYAFAITNNGYVLFHPYLSPEYEGILKPDYNSVDLAEVELRDNDLPPRGEDKLLLTLRRKMIDRERNHTKMHVKVHLDYSQRVVTRVNNYFYAPLKDTPFSFGIVMPDEYGMHQIKGQTDLRKSNDPNSIPYKRNVLSLFLGDKWLLHPEWVYCRYLYSNPNRTSRSRESLFRDVFLHMIPRRNFSWAHHIRVKSLPQPEEYLHVRATKMDRDEYYCDRELVENVVFDAGATKKFGHGVRNEPERPKMAADNGITLTFVATRSGLTRWEEFEPGSSEFIKRHTRAIDELWYKRAVDYHRVSDKAFVFSVPFNAGLVNNARVTASHALFLGTKGRKAPAAVVGLEFHHHKFMEAFWNITSKCTNASNCTYHCKSDKLNCYLLDDSGFVIASKYHENTGQFFGQIDNNIMSALIQDNTYKKIHMVDYQAVCFENIPQSQASNILITPIIQIRNLVTYMWSKLMFFYLNYNLYGLWNGDLFVAMSKPTCDDDEPLKRRPKPCDKEYYLYQLQPSKFKDNSPRRGKLFGCSKPKCNKSFVVQLVPNTNLLFMAVDATCSCGQSYYSLYHSEISYNNTQMCEWLKSNIHRRRPDQCTSFHRKELVAGVYCGGGMKLTSPALFIVIVLVIVSVLRFDRISSSGLFTS